MLAKDMLMSVAAKYLKLMIKSQSAGGQEQDQQLWGAFLLLHLATLAVDR